MSVLGKWSFNVSSFVFGEDFWRGIVAIIVFLLFWELGSRSEALFGFAFPPDVEPLLRRLLSDKFPLSARPVRNHRPIATDVCDDRADG